LVLGCMVGNCESVAYMVQKLVIYILHVSLLLPKYLSEVWILKNGPKFELLQLCFMLLLMLLVSAGNIICVTHWISHWISLLCHRS